MNLGLILNSSTNLYFVPEALSIFPSHIKSPFSFLVSISRPICVLFHRSAISHCIREQCHFVRKCLILSGFDPLLAHAQIPYELFGIAVLSKDSNGPCSIPEVLKKVTKDFEYGSLRSPDDFELFSPKINQIQDDTLDKALIAQERESRSGTPTVHISTFPLIKGFIFILYFLDAFEDNIGAKVAVYSESCGRRQQRSSEPHCPNPRNNRLLKFVYIE